MTEISFGQTSSGQVISGYNKGEMELFIFPFGMENPVPVGKISASGQVQLKWPEKLAVKDQDLSLYLTAFDNAVNLNSRQLIGNFTIQAFDNFLVPPLEKIKFL